MLEVTNANWEQNWDLNPDPISTLHFDPGLFKALERAAAGARSPCLHVYPAGSLVDPFIAFAAAVPTARGVAGQLHLTTMLGGKARMTLLRAMVIGRAHSAGERQEPPGVTGQNPISTGWP